MMLAAIVKKKSAVIMRKIMTPKSQTEIEIQQVFQKQMGAIMSFDIYQEKTGETAMYPPDKALEYLTLGLCSEAGEVAGKLKKVIRDFDGVIDEEKAQQLSLEIGDVLWYVAQLATTLGLQLSEIAEDNLNKLASRKSSGTIKGSGDYR